jgi:hypothetical protein
MAQRRKQKISQIGRCKDWCESVHEAMDDSSREDEDDEVGSHSQGGPAEPAAERSGAMPGGSGSDLLGRRGRAVAFWGAAGVMAVAVLATVVTHQAAHVVPPILALVALVDPQRRRDVLEVVRELVRRPPGPGPGGRDGLSGRGRANGRWSHRRARCRGCGS